MVRILLLALLLSPVLSLSASAFNLAALRDSVGVERRNGKFFVKHKVEPKETLYALSRKYGVPVAKIVESNPTVEASIRVDQIVLIPRNAPLSAAVNSVATPKTPAPTASSRTFTVNNKGEKIHVVEAKQTLYSISRMHGVSVESIKTWNNLADNSIEIGTGLIVGKGAVPTANKPVYVPEVDDEVEKATATTPVAAPVTPKNTSASTTKAATTTASTNPATASTSTPAESTPAVSEREEEAGTTETAAGVKKVIENGMAEMIDPKADTNKYLALHKSAPVGTIMQVKNAMNGQVVYVRVIGKLPETGTNNNVVVRISKKAYQKLGAVDQKFRVEVSYMP
ncbi:LysM peptidoglycan-binding domain-containing protein [Microvirga sp. STS03]|uniref:LysM peptidoglycan-binding domain-containing protein n=1 Tax=Pontibacter TaxID=323449 RepID=UPI001B82DB9E|nr:MULTISPECIES: LysM peptidoglycan-binding domain-containing protein [Pontibacter]MBR0571368.1 LysM peptidoglycan-binding domain-containing protein [Microvirga sp. STS03]